MPFLRNCRPSNYASVLSYWCELDRPINCEQPGVEGGPSGERGVWPWGIDMTPLSTFLAPHVKGAINPPHFDARLSDSLGLRENGDSFRFYGPVAISGPKTGLRGAWAKFSLSRPCPC